MGVYDCLCVDAVILLLIPYSVAGLGQLMNHSIKHANLKPRKEVDANGLPRIVFMATRDITAQEELLFDYGDRDHHAEFPWLST